MATTIEQVIIEFLVQDDDLDAMGKKLTSLTKIDQQNANVLQKTNVELAKRNTLLAQEYNATKKATEGTKGLNTSLQDLDEKSKQVIESFIEGFLEQAQVELKAARKEIDEMKKKFEQTGGATTSFRQKVKQLTNDMTKMKLEGRGNTAEYAALRDELGNLKDTMADVAAEAKTTGSDTRVFDGLISAAQGVAGGFAAVQGTMALMGDEGEEVQQTLLKVNAAMAILQGLQQIQQVIQKESAASLLFLNNQRKVEIVTTQVATAAESKNIVVKTASALASRALATAMALSNPITLAVVAVITALTAVYKIFTREAKETAAAQQLFNDKLEASIDIGKELDAGTKSFGARRIAELKAQGATEKQLREAELNTLYQLRVDASQRLLDIEAEGQAAIGKLRKSTNEEEIKRLTKTKEQYEAIQQSKIDIDQEIILKQFANQEAARKEQEEADKKAADEAEKLRAKRLENERKRLQQVLAGLQLEQLGVDKASQRYANLERQIIKTTGALNALGKEGNERDLAIAEAGFKEAEFLETRVESIEKSEDLISDKYKTTAKVKIDATAAIAAAEATMIGDTESAELASLELRAQAYDAFVASVQEKVAKVSAIYSQITSAVQGLQQEQQRNAQIEIDNQRAQIEEQLRLGQITEKEAEQRNERISAQEKRLKQEQARRDKQQALFSTSIAISRAIAEALTAGPILGPVLAGVIGVLGLAQLNAIRNRPIPKFGTGKKGAYKGIGEVGETGPELIERRDGSLQYVGKRSLTYLDRDDKVYTPSETSKMMRENANLEYVNTRARAGEHASDSFIDYDTLADVIANKASSMHMNVDENGLRVWIQKGNSRTEYLNKKRMF